MGYNPLIHQRRSIRLPGFDYTSAGHYFVTICTKDRNPLLGQVIDDCVDLSTYGDIVADCWRWLSERYPYIELDEWVVMPNHLHGILVISDDGRGGSRTAPTTHTTTTKIKPLGRIIGAFKTVSTKNINAIRNTPGNKIWHRNYYEHVIRNEKELHKIREYIQSNPAQWQLDEDNPENWDK